MSLSGMADGPRDLEFRVIEAGGSTALATGTSVLMGGGVEELISLDMAPPGPWAQTAPAGTVVLQLQARVTSAGSAALSGEIAVNYVPGS